LLNEPTQDLTSEELPPLSNLPLYAAKQIDKIIKDEIISTADGITRRYLVHWKKKHESDDTWLDREDALERYESNRDIHSMGSSFSHPREIDEDIRART